MGAAVPFILCHVLATVKWKLLLLEVWIKHEEKKRRGDVARTEICEMSGIIHFIRILFQG